MKTSLGRSTSTIAFVNNVKYFGVILNKRITWRLHIERIEAKAFRTFIRLYPPFISERLNTIIKVTLLKAPIRYVMTYSCPAWEFGAETHLFILQRLQNRVLRIIRNSSWRTSVRDFHMAFQIPYVYDYITNLCRQQRSFKIMIMKMFATLDKAKLEIESIRGLNMAAVTRTAVQVSRLATISRA
jgi:hypothetical protein